MKKSIMLLALMCFAVHAMAVDFVASKTMFDEATYLVD